MNGKFISWVSEEAMKIVFEDGSFLELLKEDDGTVTIVLCGFKGKNQLTMSSSKLSADQINKILEFLNNI